MSITGALTRAPLAPALWGLDGLSPAARAARYGLVAAWNFDEASGNRADSFGANTLTDNNTVTTATAKLGANAAQFTAANSEFLSIVDNPALSTGNILFWMAGWVWLDTKTGIMCFFTKEDVAAEWRLDYTNSTDRFRFFVNAGGFKSVSASTFGAVATGTWHFVFAWHDPDADTVNIAINDGAANSGTTGGATPTDTGATIRIGATQSPESAFMNGRIDALAFGKFPLASIAEIRAYLYNGGAGRQYPDGWT